MTETPHFLVRLTAADRAALERIAAKVVPDTALARNAPRNASRVAPMLRMIAAGALLVVEAEQAPAAGEQAEKEQG
jgi:hypothetical protein